jgi:hypothetical protein
VSTRCCYWSISHVINEDLLVLSWERSILSQHNCLSRVVGSFRTNPLVTALFILGVYEVLVDHLLVSETTSYKKYNFTGSGLLCFEHIVEPFPSGNDYYLTMLISFF